MSTTVAPDISARQVKQGYLTHATLVLPDETIHDGTLVLEKGRIAAICPDGLHGRAEEHDLEGDVLMPGLIDLHGDAIEREMEPRDRAMLPLPHAVVQGDRKCALAGITTPFHALAFAGEDRGEIGVGKRADLIAIQRQHDTPTVQRLWSRSHLALCFS